MKTRKDIINLLLYSGIFMISFLGLSFGSDVKNDIYYFTLPLIYMLFYTKLDIASPLFWFSSSFWLYTSAFPILYIMGYPVETYYSSPLLIYGLIALYFALLPNILSKEKKIKFESLNSSNYSGKHIRKESFAILMNIMILIMIFLLFQLKRSNFAHKNELLSNRNFYFLLANYITRIITFIFPAYYITKNNRQFFSLYLPVFVVATFTLLTGERDALIRIGVVLVFILFFDKKISKMKLLILVPVSFLLLILMNYLKYYFVSGNLRSNLLDQDLIYTILTLDFSAPGENFQQLLNSSNLPTFGSKLLIYDFLTPILPGRYLFNIGEWFNNTFYFNSYSRAFTLLGEGYLINRYIGIPLIFYVYGKIIKSFNNIKDKSLFIFSLYIFLVPTVIQSFRAPFGSFLSIMFRISIISLALLFFISLIIKERMK